MAKSSNPGSRIKEFCVFTTNCSTKLKVHDLHLLECLTQYKGPYNSLTLLAKARAKNEQVIPVRYLSKKNSKSSHGRRVRLFKTITSFHGRSVALNRRYCQPQFFTKTQVELSYLYIHNVQ